MRLPSSHTLNGWAFVGFCVFIAWALYTNVIKPSGATGPAANASTLVRSDGDNATDAIDELASEADRRADAATNLGAASESGGSQAESPELYYGLSDDPDAPHLLGLSTIENVGDKLTVLTVDLFRGEIESGLISTWQMDCKRREMRIIEGMTFSPTERGERSAVTSEIVLADATIQSRTQFRLVCEGQGNLEKNRVRRGSLREIITEFWAR